MSASVLKQTITNAGLSYVGCVEKAELRALFVLALFFLVSFVFFL